MKIPVVLRPEGKYNRGQYIFADLATSFVIFGLIFLATLHVALIPFTVLCCLLMIYIDVIATIKRLRDLGRPERDYFLLYIPFLCWFVDMALWFKSGQEEINQEASREYMIQQYEKKHRRREESYENRRNIPRRYDDFRLHR